MQHLAANGGITDHPLLKPADEVRKVAFVVISSDRGLAGGYNSAVIRAAERELQARQLEGVDYSLVLVGKKVDSYFRYRRYRVDRSFHGISDSPSYADAIAVGEVISDLFTSGEVQEVVLVFTRFISLGTQQVAVRRFLPLTGVGQETDETRAKASYEFEPAPGPIFDSLIPRYITARIYAALLDAAASEHASRQRAMKSATDNAEELIVAVPRHEPGPPGQHHQRDHGDRRWRGGPPAEPDRCVGPADRPRLAERSAHPAPPRTHGTLQLRRAVMTITNEPSTALKDGRVVTIAGPVVDVEFPPDALPQINTALSMTVELDGVQSEVRAEVAQQIGDNRVRAICLKPTDGLRRGAIVRNTGAGITVPVGDKVLGHVFNVIGEPLDITSEELGEVADRWEIHRSGPHLRLPRAVGHDVRDRHQGHRPAHPLQAGRQDRPVRWCRRGQDGAHHRDDPPCGPEPRWRLGVRRRGRAHP
jgi:ATP synthase F1 gamma subunit